jgi:hypothetical protein
VADRRSEAVFRSAARLVSSPVTSSKSEVLIEFVVQGNVVKATALDPVSGLEASIVGPASGSRDALAQAAVRKLQYVLEKNRR